MKKFKNEYRKYLVERLSRLRVERDIAARDLSLSIGKSDGYIAKFESGIMNMPSEVLLDTLKVLEVSEAKFFSENPNSYDEDQLILEKWKKLSKENRELLLTLMDKLK